MGVTAIVLLLLVSGCEKQEAPQQAVYQPAYRPADLTAGTKFTPLPAKIVTTPEIKILPVPLPAYATNVSAIWGATGRDDAGNIYYGVSTAGVAESVGNDSRTAYLFQYNPVLDITTAQSDVLSELKRSGLYRPGMGQNKLHSKFYQADDGYLYFTSFDEEGEDDVTNPTWGGHLWRKKPDDIHWEHLLSAEEALVALNTNGRYVYMLGYWDHVLYQYDISNAAVKRTVVGSVKNHVSRNFLVDSQGHAYVPALTESATGDISVVLNHYNEQLQLLATYPLADYNHPNHIKYHHGIVGYTAMRNGDIFFTTSDGNLYQLSTRENGPQKLVAYGSMHPQKNTYIASLFSFEGQEYLLGATQGSKAGMEWVIYHTGLKSAITLPLSGPAVKRADYWGTNTKDDQGNFYVAGWQLISNEAGYQPVFSKISIPAASAAGN
ncbi:hypothetical protein GCM10011338_32020 [Alteromonas lipolytica]|nr:hypothetical protein GCM10011338_32020 [Alteromonas lipolytica]